MVCQARIVRKESEQSVPEFRYRIVSNHRTQECQLLRLGIGPRLRERLDTFLSLLTISTCTLD